MEDGLGLPESCSGVPSAELVTEAARSVWAKSLNDCGDWLPLWRHMDDSAAVAGWLFDNWVAPAVTGFLARDFGGDVDQARCAVRFLAGMHDLGKTTPAFAIQHDLLAQGMRERGLSMPTTKRELPDREKVYHALAGHHLLVGWLQDRGWTRSRAKTWAVVVGGHHGVPPDNNAVREARPQNYPYLYGQGTWQRVQREFADRVAAATGAMQYLDEWSTIDLSAEFQVLSTGLVIMSDWIASNESLMPYLSGSLPSITADPERPRNALQRLALPKPWRPATAGMAVDALFAARFSLPEGARPRPVQEAACVVARRMSQPGLLIVEAPMGEGKTEAALAAAEIMAERWGCGGVQVALPTQATTNAMFDRVVAWLDAMGTDGKVIGAVTLGHGKARLNRLYGGLIRDGRQREAEIGCDEHDSGARRSRQRPSHAVVAHSWLSGRKKAPLANFVIGTIDQLLFAALKSRHLMLRHLGLAGKVVIIDEVHAYDAYMNSYLQMVLTWLGAYRVPVIALSATLPAERRSELLAAYRRGLTGSEYEYPAEVHGGYPMLSWTDGEDVVAHDVERSGRQTMVRLRALGGGTDDDLPRLGALLLELLAEGGCALVVRNTVRRVLETADYLDADGRFAGEVTVAHSRFLAADRAHTDEQLLECYGPSARARPSRRVVVASQVVEQSLDVDFDVLVTDLAPIDLVLQRIGRLHRHRRGQGQAERPAKLRSAAVYIAGVDFTADPPTLETAASRHIYGAYPLLRAAAVLRDRLEDTISLPDDIPDLVQRAYGNEEIGPTQWQTALAEAKDRWGQTIRARIAKAEEFQLKPPAAPGTAITGWIRAGIGEVDEDTAEGQGQVRDGAPSLEVIVVQQTGVGRWRTPCWLPDGQGGMPIPVDHTPDDDTARVMVACSLRLPLEFSNAESEESLWNATPTAWENSSLIYRMPVLVIDDHGHGHIGEAPVRYTPDRGLETG